MCFVIVIMIICYVLFIMLFVFLLFVLFFFFFKQKTAYEMRISDWSSDVCSSDLQARRLSGLERAQPLWKIDGDDGVAMIELEPTTASGTLSIDFLFRDDKVVRKQTVETWLDPGDRPWTVVGFAAGKLGYKPQDRKRVV